VGIALEDMSFAHYIISWLKQRLALFAGVIGVLVGFFVIITGAGGNNKFVFCLGVFIIIISALSAKYFYWKHKVMLQAGTRYVTKNRNY